MQITQSSDIKFWVKNEVREGEQQQKWESTASSCLAGSGLTVMTQPKEGTEDRRLNWKQKKRFPLSWVLDSFQSPLSKCFQRSVSSIGTKAWSSPQLDTFGWVLGKLHKNSGRTLVNSSSNIYQRVFTFMVCDGPQKRAILYWSFVFLHLTDWVNGKQP